MSTDPKPASSLDAATAKRRRALWVEAEMRRGKTPEEIQANLVAHGWGKEDAGAVVDRVTWESKQAAEYESVQQDALDRGHRARCRSAMTYGALILIAGISITVATRMAAARGSSYIIAWGAIFVGAVQFLSGLIGYLISD